MRIRMARRRFVIRFPRTAGRQHFKPRVGRRGAPKGFEHRLDLDLPLHQLLLALDECGALLLDLGAFATDGLRMARLLLG
jgi:hypothetical protein